MPDVNRNRDAAPGFDPRLFLRDEELDYGISLILSAERALARKAQDLAKDEKIPQLAARVLLALRFNPGPTAKELRFELDTTTPTLARILADLTERGYIYRGPSEGDRRAKPLFLTSDGKRVTNEATLAMRATLRATYRKVGATSVAGARQMLEDLSK